MKSTLKLDKLLSASAIAFAVTLASSSYAYADNTRNTYVGLDVVYNSMKLKKDYGGNIFSKKMAPGLNFFVGHMFHENFGAELGIEVEKKMKRTETIRPGEKVAGVNVPTSQIFETYETSMKQRHPYMGLLAKFNLFNNTFASLMLGGSLSHIKATMSLINDGVPVAPPYPTVNALFSKTKLIPIIKFTLEQKISNNFNIRGLISWKNTGAINTIKVKEINDQTFNRWELKLKNSFNFGVGIAYYI